MIWIEDPRGSISVVENRLDLKVFADWLADQHRVAVDTETTGLNIYQRGFHPRLIIVAVRDRAWVIPAEGAYEGLGYLASLYLDRQNLELVFHNASFDIQVMAHVYQWPIAATYERSHDTRIYAHLIDPRGREEGGTGHSLDELANWYLGSSKTKKELSEEFIRLQRKERAFRRSASKIDRLLSQNPRTEKTKSRRDEQLAEAMAIFEEGGGDVPIDVGVSEMYRHIPLFNEVFLRYAGVDGLLTMQLFEALNGSRKPNPQLIAFEHKLAAVVAQMDAHGLLLDRPYAERLSAELREKEEGWKATAALGGIENINSVDQVAAWFEARGFEIPKTDKGNPSIDGAFLKDAIEEFGEEDKEVAAMATAIIEGKRAGKQRSTWVDKFLEEADENDRVHPSTNPLRARTARFSISGVPAQTLPPAVRDCFIAEEGERFASFDYKQQELRYGGAASKDPALIRLLSKGGDPYQAIADKLGKDRKAGKMTALATFYGVGKDKLGEQLGIPSEDAGELRTSFKASFPTLQSWGRQLASEAESAGSIITANGRRLPVDADRTYAALNYYVQSGCRDITAQALTDLAEAGYLENMRLAIHDEIVFSLPEGADVEEIIRIMSVKVGAVDLPAEAKIGERSWGSIPKD